MNVPSRPPEDVLEARRRAFVAMLQEGPLARTFGMRLAWEGDQSLILLPYNPNLNHGLGATHGGVLATLLDNAGWFAIAPFTDRWIATVDLHVHLLEPTVGNPLVARGRIVRLGTRLSVADMEVWASPALVAGEGRLVATGSGTFTSTGVEIPKPRGP